MMLRFVLSLSFSATGFSVLLDVCCFEGLHSLNGSCDVDRPYESTDWQVLEQGGSRLVIDYNLVHHSR